MPTTGSFDKSPSGQNADGRQHAPMEAVDTPATRIQTDSMAKDLHQRVEQLNNIPEIPGYSILREIGRGGMGVVFQAKQQGLDRLVAIKMILAGAYASTEDRIRFKIEAETAARIHHPNVVQVVETGEHKGWPFLVMEWSGGGTLSHWLRGKTEQPRPKEVAAFVETLAHAVHAAHCCGVIHRDLKPSNILMGRSKATSSSGSSNETKTHEAYSYGSEVALFVTLPEYQPKISDFGLAKRLDSDANLTGSAAIMGTPQYMAPEQATKRQKELGPSTDVYSLGVILYELLAGRVPFQGETASVLQAIQNQEVPSFQSLRVKMPRDLEVIARKCLEKNPARRYANAEDLADDLRRWLEEEPIHARPVSTSEKAWRWCVRKPLAASLLGLLVLATILALNFGVNASKARDDAKSAEQFAIKAQEALVREVKAKQAETDRAKEAENIANTANETAKKAKEDAVAKSIALDVAQSQIIGEFSDPIGIAGPTNPIPSRIGGQRTFKQNLTEANRIAKRTLGNKPLLYASSLELIGRSYQKIGYYEESEIHLKQALNLRETNYADSKADIGDSHHYLGVLYFEWGYFKRAAVEFALAIDTYKKYQLVSTDHRITDTMYKRAWLHLACEEYAEAGKLFEDAESLIKERGGENTREMLMCKMGQASLYLSRMDFQKGLPIALAAWPKILEVNNVPELKSSVTTLIAAIGVRKFNPKGAIKNMELVFEKLKSIVGDDSQYSSYYRALLADFYLGDKQYDKAEVLFKEALKHHEKTLGYEHDNTFFILNEYGKMLHTQDRGKEIDVEYHKFLIAQDERWPDEEAGVKNFKRGQARVRYAELLQERKEYAMQAQFAKHALDIYDANKRQGKPLYIKAQELLADAQKHFQK